MWLCHNSVFAAVLRHITQAAGTNIKKDIRLIFSHARNIRIQLIFKKTEDNQNINICCERKFEIIVSI